MGQPAARQGQPEGERPENRAGRRHTAAQARRGHLGRGARQVLQDPGTRAPQCTAACTAQCTAACTAQCSARRATRDAPDRHAAPPPRQTGKFQKIENLNIPLKYINSFNASIGIKTSYSAEDIYEGNVTLILGMVWCLILRYSVAEISEGDLTAKEGLLLWAQKKVAKP